MKCNAPCPTKEKKRKDYTFWRQINEKPRILYILYYYIILYYTKLPSPPVKAPHLFRLYRCPSGSSPEVLVLVIPKHGAGEGHELEVGCDLADVAQDEMHLLLLAVEGLAYLCTGGLQLTPGGTHRQKVLILAQGALFLL